MTYLKRLVKDKIKDTVLAVCQAANIRRLPVSINDILKAYKIYCIPVDCAASRGSIEISDDGYVFRRGDVHYIFYNALHQKYRIRWTIAYQLGHIFLQHLDGRDIGDYEDAECNYFAKEMLCPLAVLDRAGARTVQDIHKLCEVSLKAAEIRMRDFSRRDKYKQANGDTVHDVRFINQFSEMDMKSESNDIYDKGEENAE